MELGIIEAAKNAKATIDQIKTKYSLAPEMEAKFKAYAKV
jgi:hypothetical protein